MLKSQVENMTGWAAAHASSFHRSMAFALQFLSGERPFTLFTLRQIRDAADPDRACYQSLVRVRRKLTTFEIREIEKNLVVRLQNPPSLRIVDILGLEGVAVPGDGAGTAYLLHPICPFWLRGDLSEGLSQVVRERKRQPAWGRTEGLEDLSKSSPDFFEPANLLTELAEGDFGLALDRIRQGLQGQRNSIGRVLADVSSIDPQMIVQGILAREIGNRSPNTAWRRRRAAYHETMMDYHALVQRTRPRPRP
jgi:hypothetical protein